MKWKERKCCHVSYQYADIQRQTDRKTMHFFIFICINDSSVQQWRNVSELFYNVTSIHSSLFFSSLNIDSPVKGRGWS